MTERRKLLPWLVALGLLVPFAYRDLWQSWFLRDDFMWLHDAEQQLAEPLKFLTWRPSGYFRPVTNLLFGLERLVFGLEPAGYYSVNVLLHIWNAAWLGFLVLAFGGGARFAGAASLTAGLLTAAAPGVVWISGQVSLLAVAFILPAVFFYDAYLAAGRRRDLALAVACVALAVGSRESGVLAGVLVLMLELRHAGPSGFLGSAFWRRMAPFVVLAVAYAVVQLSFLQSGAIARTGGGGSLGFVTNALANFAPLMWFTSWAKVREPLFGMAFLALALALLGSLRGRRGILLFGALGGLFLLALLPTYPLLSAGPEVAARYRYEASFVAALFVGAQFAALFDPLFADDARRRGLVRMTRALGVAALAVVLGGHLLHMPDFVDGSKRYAEYADQTKLLAESLEARLGDELRREPGAAGTDAAAARYALVGIPVENPRHLRCQLAVWYDLPFETVEELRIELAEPGVRDSVRRQGLAGIAARARADEVLLWDRERGLVPVAELPDGLGTNVMPAVNRDWRRPGRRAERTDVQILVLPQARASAPEAGP